MAAPPLADRDVKPANVPPPAPDHLVPCRICGTTDPAAAWVQLNLCGAAKCIDAAARAGKDKAKAARTPALARRASRRDKIAKLIGRRERFAAQAERAELGADDGEEDLVERFDRIPEVADA